MFQTKTEWYIDQHINSQPAVIVEIFCAIWILLSCMGMQIMQCSKKNFKHDNPSRKQSSHLFKPSQRDGQTNILNKQF